MQPQGRTRIILMFGPSGAGKSTLARLLAGRLPRCAHIEVDVLHYMVVGGLVAGSAGTPPHEAPEEYRRQCWLSVANAVRLAHGFASEGFSSVIEGLEEDCRPGTGWIERTFPGRPVITVAVVCADEVLSKRWRERGWGEQLSDDAAASLRWYRENQPLFTCAVDTTDRVPEEIIAILNECCLGRMA
jgi:chloramphenicol 3-O-phosphotransferase